MKTVLTVHADYRKAQIPVDDIAYITVEERKTKITRGDGSVLRTNQSLKDIFAQLPEETFLNINRGIVISKRFIQDEKNGEITMTDGARFRRRVRADRAPKRPRQPAAPKREKRAVCPAETLAQWLDPMPVPVLIMELVYGSGGGVDFLVRYLSREMAQLESVTIDEILNQSVLKLSNVGSPKWMAIFADVAIHGGTRVIEDVLEGSGKYMQLRCYQPQPGFCGCVLTDLTKENNLVQELFRAR